MSVNGINRFREAMKGFEDCYVLIGGSACDLLLTEQGERFRATKDLDIVILTENATNSFAEAFWNFVIQGGYEPWCSSVGKVHFYRFIHPKMDDYPHMIELFARHPQFTLTNENTVIAPLPLDEEISSLSAILLNDNYYAILLDGLNVVNGISTLDEAHLIVLKMRAHIDLNNRATAGQHVNKADLKKHRKDVLRLLEFVPSDVVLSLPKALQHDAQRFIETVEDPNFRFDQIGLSMNRTSAIEHLRRLCKIESEK